MQLERKWHSTEISGGIRQTRVHKQAVTALTSASASLPFFFFAFFSDLGSAAAAGSAAASSFSLRFLS